MAENTRIVRCGKTAGLSCRCSAKVPSVCCRSPQRLSKFTLTQPWFDRMIIIDGGEADALVHSIAPVVVMEPRDACIASAGALSGLWLA